MLIATTEGPVAVQKITAEDPDVPSVVCRDGTTEVLAISRDYTRFVDRGTGIVARLTGHGAYRLDLDRRVDGGRSWQLPVLVAHLLEAEGRLAGAEEVADLTLLATGEVDREQRVRPVDRLDQKLSAARALIDRHVERGSPVVVLVPGSEASPKLASRLPVAAEGHVRLLAWDRLESLDALGAPPAPETAPRGRGTSSEIRSSSAGRADDTVADAGFPGDRVSTRPALRPGGSILAPFGARRPGKGRRAERRAGVWLVSLLAIAGAGISLWWTGPRHWEEMRLDGDYLALEESLRRALIPAMAERYRQGLHARILPPESLVFGLVERRSADGGSCSGRAFRGAGGEDLAEFSLDALKPGFFRSQSGASLCEAVYRVANEGERLAYLYFAVRPVLSGQAEGKRPSALRRAAALPPGASLALELELDRQPARPLGADLLVLAVPTPAPQLRRAFESATGDGAAGEGAGLLDLTALPSLGLTVKAASHAILR